MEKKKLGIKVESSENVGTKMWFSPMLNDINLLTICNLKIKSYRMVQFTQGISYVLKHVKMLLLPFNLTSYYIIILLRSSCIYIYIYIYMVSLIFLHYLVEYIL